MENFNKSSPIDIKQTKNNNLDKLNYSIYEEKQLSLSNLSNSPDDIFSNYFQKRNDKWVDSTIIQRCQLCDTYFNFFTRKHHCRACGGVFCTNCCNKFMTIPESIIKKPIKEDSIKTTLTNSLRWLYGEKNDLVCNTCDKKINDLKSIEYLIKIFEYLPLNELYRIKIVCKNFNTASTHILSKFRDIQYGEHLKIYTEWEKEIIWNSREYLLNHSIWFTILIKSTLLYTIETFNLDRIKDINIYLKNIINNKQYFKKQSCFSLLCSRKCNNKLDFDDIIEIFDYIKFLVKKYDNLFEFEDIKNIMLNLINILINLNHFEKIYPIILNLLNYIFEYEDIHLDDNFTEKLFNIILKSHNENKNIIYLITLENNFIEYLNINKQFAIESDIFFKMINKYIIKYYKINFITNIFKMNRTIINILNNKEYKDDLPIFYPFDIKYKITKILKIEVINSNTKPVLIEAELTNENYEKKNIKFIIKKDKSLRKEQIVSCLINILLYKLNNMKLQLIPTYKILMLTDEIGVIEYVENSHTLRSIGDKGYSLQNYILNLNPTSTLDTIKTRFVHSLSISSAISYIIGLGDRHLDNIMINNLGQIFHIDFGYIMDNPIKIFNMPEIKLTNDIIDFLGGVNSIYYQDFKKMIVQIYNLYRANKTVLYIFFKYLGDSGYMDWSQISSKLDTKLMIGMKCKDVEITLINEIDSSNSITDMFTDMCHNYKYRFF
jgi:hypothetical protein